MNLRLFPAILMLGCVVLAGCSTSRTASRDAASMEQLNRDLAARTARVQLLDGRTLDATGLRFAPDSTSWINPESGTVALIPTDSIFHVSTSNRGRTTGKGAKTGAIIGGIAVGAATAAMVYGIGDLCVRACDERKPPPMAGPAALGFVLGGAVGAAAGGLYGTVIGFLIGGRDEVRFEPPARARGDARKP